MAVYYQSQPYTRMFTLVQSSDHTTALTGASPTVRLSKAGASFIYSDVAAAEVGLGWYSLPLTTTSTNTIGDLAFHVTAASADDRDWVDQVLAGVQVATIVDSVKADLVSQVWATPVRAVTSVSSPVGVASNYDKGNYTLSTVGTEGLGPFLINAIWATPVRRLDSTGATQIADSVLDRNLALGVDSGSPTVRTVRQALRTSRNKVDLPGGVVYKEDDATVSWTFTVASDSSTTRITSVDPAGP